MRGLDGRMKKTRVNVAYVEEWEWERKRRRKKEENKKKVGDERTLPLNTK